MRSPSGPRSSAKARVTASTTVRARHRSHLSRPPGAAADAERARAPARRRAVQCGRDRRPPRPLMDDASPPPLGLVGMVAAGVRPPGLLSLRRGAEHAAATVTRLASSPSAGSPARDRQHAGHRLDGGSGAGQRSVGADDPRPFRHRPLQLVARFGQVVRRAHRRRWPMRRPGRRPSFAVRHPATPSSRQEPGRRATTGRGRQGARSGKGHRSRPRSPRPGGRRRPCPRATSSRRAGWRRAPRYRPPRRRPTTPGGRSLPCRSVSTPPER